MATYQERYERAKKAGKCPNHPAVDAASGHVNCRKCIDGANRMYIGTGLPKSASAVVGEIAEWLVGLDFSARKMEWYKPDSVCHGKTDLYVRSSVGWIGVQVKAVPERRTKDGFSFSINRQSKINSDIVAVVRRSTGTILYLPWNKALPPELPRLPVPHAFQSTASPQEEEDAAA